MQSEMYTAAQGLLARQIQLDNIAHNIANSATTGFREVSPFFRSLNEALAEGPGNPLNNAANNQPVAAGVFLHSREGAIKATENPLDLAIAGDGFFKVQTPFGQRYTRNGNFTMNNEGQLVTRNGYPVMDSNDQPIIFDPDQTGFYVTSQGDVLQNGELKGRVKLVTFADKTPLTPEEDTLLVMNDPNAAEQQADGRIMSNALEGSNVNIAKQMVDMITAQRAYEINTRTIKTIDSSFNDGIIRTHGPR